MMSLTPFYVTALTALVTPAPIAMAILGLAGLLGRRGEGATSPRWAGALGLGLGYAAGHFAGLGWWPRVVPWLASVRHWAVSAEGDWPFSVGVAGEWAFWLALAAMLLGILDCASPAPAWARWQSRILLTAATLALVLRSRYADVWDARQATIWTIGLGVGILLFWAILDARASRLGPGMPLSWAILAAGLAATLILNHASERMFMAGALASASAGAWVVSWWDRRLNLGRGAAPVFAVAYAAILLDAYFLQEVPASMVLPLATAPLATFIDRIGPIARLSPWKVGLIRAVAIAIPVGVAVGLAYSKWSPDGY